MAIAEKSKKYQDPSLYRCPEPKIKPNEIPGILSLSAVSFGVIGLCVGIAAGIVSVVGVVFIATVLGIVAGILCGVGIILFIAAAIKNKHLNS